jgi:predicted Ser/Thr protein kinase
MLKINLTLLKTKISKYVDTYYSLADKPDVPELEKDKQWIKDMVSNSVEFAIINLELKDVQRIEVSERIVDWDHVPTMQSCIKKKGYDIEKRLGEYSNKFLLKGNKTAKVKLISLWEYKQKDEMKSVINNEFQICKKVEALGIGPKIYDSFICFNKQEGKAYKVLISEYINGLSLEEWGKTNRSPEERSLVHSLVKTKIEKMHENGVIHNSLFYTPGNVILKTLRGKVVEALITDFVRSYDVQDRKMWDYNKWIQEDRQVLSNIKKTARSYNNADDVVNYVAHMLLTNKDVVIQ